MIDGTKKTQNPSKFAKRAARYNELGYIKSEHLQALFFFQKANV